MLTCLLTVWKRVASANKKDAYYSIKKCFLTCASAYLNKEGCSLSILSLSQLSEVKIAFA